MGGTEECASPFRAMSFWPKLTGAAGVMAPPMPERLQGRVQHMASCETRPAKMMPAVGQRDLSLGKGVPANETGQELAKRPGHQLVWSG